MNNANLIGIHMRSVATDMQSFAETGIYRVVPQILYKINSGPIQEFHIGRPVEVFRKSMNYKDFESIVKSDRGSMEFMSMPGKAYQKMQYYVNKNVDKVLADMLTAVIARIIKEVDSAQENVFFISNRDSNKVIGRLGYLYLDNNKNTFCFVSYKPDNLLTNTMRNGSDVLEFDISYFKRYKNKERSEVVPNDFMESLLQTVFYRVSDREAELPPMRCDIFSQGISNREIQEKAQKVQRILADQNNMTIPFKDAGQYVRIPNVLSECIQAEERFQGSIECMLEER